MRTPTPPKSWPYWSIGTKTGRNYGTHRTCGGRKCIQMASMRRQNRVRYYDTHGAQCHPLKATTKRTEKSKIYYAFGAIPGSRRPIPLATTHAESAGMLARIMAGTTPPAAGAAPLATHMESWAASLKLAGLTLKRQSEVVGKVKRILIAAGVLHGTSISAEQTRAVFTRWNDEKRRWSAQTKAHYLKALNQFLRYAALPSIKINLPIIRANKTYQRGALTLQQATDLITTTARSPDSFRGLTGHRRALLYRLILTTGLRRAELMALTPAHLRASKISLIAGETKNRRPANIDVAPALSTALATITGRLFPGTWHDRSAVMVRKDAAAAGITTTTQLDLHSLRHTFITWCAAKFRIEITQKLARHSTSVLTLDYYTHPKNDDITAAAAVIENDLQRCAVRCVIKIENKVIVANQKKKVFNNPAENR